MEESMVLRKSGAVPLAATIDCAVISSVRRLLFRDKLKCRSKSLSLSTARCREFTFIPFVIFLTIRIGGVHPQRLQGICACVQ